ncbi:MAG: protein kinase [Deltaproteobacteria bacterium]|nr:protein kinase [Deltaproteobacteria bacterium]
MEPGTILFGRYLLFERISSGGKAEIWRAARQGREGFVAIKRLRPSLAKDPELQARFINEAKIAVQLAHPNIAQVFDLGLVNDDFYIELEYLPGADLRTVLPRCEGPGVLPHGLAALMAVELCDALDHLHRRAGPTGLALQLVHREVSPDNCVITYEGAVKLVGFSAATGAPLAAQGGAAQGGFAYLSPEQLHGQPLDRRSDVYSLSAVIYEALTGRRLSVALSEPGAKALHCCRPILPPRAVIPAIPADLERIVLTGLEHDRQRRYPGASEMGEALRNFLGRQAKPPDRGGLRELMRRHFATEIAEEDARSQELRSRMPVHELSTLVEGRVTAPEGFDFDIDESLMEQVVQITDLHPLVAEDELIVTEETTLPRAQVPSSRTPSETLRPIPPPRPAGAVPVPGLVDEALATKRHAKRWSITVPVKGVWGSAGKLMKPFSASLLNLSTTGALLQTSPEIAFPAQAKLGFTLCLRSHNLIALEGAVRWQRQSAAGWEVGVEFLQPHPELLKLHRVR